MYRPPVAVTHIQEVPFVSMKDLRIDGALFVQLYLAVYVSPIQYCRFGHVVLRNDSKLCFINSKSYANNSLCENILVLFFKHLIFNLYPDTANFESINVSF